MPPYPPRTVPGGWWRRLGLPPRTAPDSVTSLNTDRESRVADRKALGCHYGFTPFYTLTGSVVKAACQRSSSGMCSAILINIEAYLNHQTYMRQTTEKHQWKAFCVDKCNCSINLRQTETGFHGRKMYVVNKKCQSNFITNRKCRKVCNLNTRYNFENLWVPIRNPTDLRPAESVTASVCGQYASPPRCQLCPVKKQQRLAKMFWSDLS